MIIPAIPFANLIFIWHRCPSKGTKTWPGSKYPTPWRGSFWLHPFSGGNRDIWCQWWEHDASQNSIPAQAAIDDHHYYHDHQRWPDFAVRHQCHNGREWPSHAGAWAKALSGALRTEYRLYTKVRGSVREIRDNERSGNVEWSRQCHTLGWQGKQANIEPFLKLRWKMETIQTCRRTW